MTSSLVGFGWISSQYVQRMQLSDTAWRCADRRLSEIPSALFTAEALPLARNFIQWCSAIFVPQMTRDPRSREVEVLTARLLRNGLFAGIDSSVDRETSVQHDYGENSLGSAIVPI
jgi:hypothetical protein